MQFLGVQKDKEVTIYTMRRVGNTKVVESFALGEKDEGLMRALSAIGKL